jgi:hypothetical protein
MTMTFADSPAGPMAMPPIPAPSSPAMLPPARAISDLVLVATSTAVSCARLFVECTLRQWDRRELTDGATWLAAELVADTVRLTGFPDPDARWVDADDLALLRVRLVLLEHGIICDRHTELPTPSEPFRAICTRWNAYLTRGGRVVWGELTLPTPELTKHGLPRRTPSPVRPAAQPGQHATDPVLLRRVREGLGGL